MAKHYVNPYVSINNVDLSDHVREVTINMEREDLDATCSGASGKERIPGLRDESFEMTLAQDFDGSEVDATLTGLYTDGTRFEVIVKPRAGSTSSTNPAFEGNVYLLSYPPLSGAVGVLAETQIKLPVDGVITRATT